MFNSSFFCLQENGKEAYIADLPGKLEPFEVSVAISNYLMPFKQFA